MAPDRTAEELYRGVERVYLLAAALFVLAGFLAVAIPMVWFADATAELDCGDDASAECEAYED